MSYYKGRIKAIITDDKGNIQNVIREGNFFWAEIGMWLFIMFLVKYLQYLFI